MTTTTATTTSTAGDGAEAAQRDAVARLRAKKPRQVTIGIAADDLSDAHEAAVNALAAAERSQFASRARRIAEAVQAGEQPDVAIARVDADDTRALDPLRSQVDGTRAELDDATVWFTFTALGRSRFLSLAAEHPPTDADHERARQRGEEPAEFAPSFLPALMQACCTSFPLTDEDLQQMFDGDAWSDAELGALTAAAMSANVAARLTPQRP